MSTAGVANGSKSRETPGKDALPARVFHIDSASSIWAQIGPAETCAVFDKFLDGVNLTCEGFGDAGRGVAKPPPISSVLALMDPDTGKWERAMVTSGPSGDEFDVLFIDTGESRKGNVRNVCNQSVPQLLKMAAQAVQCRLVGIDLERSPLDTAARLKELFDQATEVKVEVYSVPRKQQCNAAFFVMIDGQWRSVVTALNQFNLANNEHTSMTKGEVATAEEPTSPPFTPPYESIPPKSANREPQQSSLEDTIMFAECTLNGDAQQPAEPLPESPVNSPSPPSPLSPPSHPTPTSVQPMPLSSLPTSSHVTLTSHFTPTSSHFTPTSSHVTGMTGPPGSGEDASWGHLEVEGGGGKEEDQKVSCETSKGAGKGTKEGVAQDLNSSSSSDEEWDESLLVPHQVPPSKDTTLTTTTSNKEFCFARKVFNRGLDEEKSKSKASFENQFNQLMSSGSGQYSHRRKGNSPYRGGGHRGGKGAGRGLDMARRPLHYGDEVTKGPVKTLPARIKEEEEPAVVEEQSRVSSFPIMKTGLVLRSDSNDISWYSYRVELCIRKLLDSPTTATELDASIRKMMAEESNVHKLVTLAGNERVVLAILKSLIYSSITTKSGCTEIVAQAIVHFCNSGHPLSETPLFLLPAMEEITSDSLMTSTASDTWKYRRSFSCFFTSLYLSCSRQNNSVLTSTMDQLVHHYLDKWSNRLSVPAEQRPASAPPTNVGNIESLVCLLQELGTVLDHRDRKTLDVYFDGVLKDFILNEGLQRPAKETLYNLALQRREWLAKNFPGGQEKQAPHPMPPPLPPTQCSPSEVQRERGNGAQCPTPSTTIAETTAQQQHQVLPSPVLHGNMSPHPMATGVSYKDPYKMVRQVLEELGCSEQISKFTGACYTDMVLEECDHETIWKGLKELGVPMGVATRILGTRQNRKTNKAAGTDIQLTSAQQHTSVAVTPQQYTSVAVTPQQYTSVAAMTSQQYASAVTTPQQYALVATTPQQYASVAMAPQQYASTAMAPQQYSLPYQPAYPTYSVGPTGVSPSVSHGPHQQMAPAYMAAPSGTPLQMMPPNHGVPLPYCGDQLWKPVPMPQQDVCRGSIPGGEGVSPMSHVGSRLYGNQQAPSLTGVTEVQLPPPPPPSRPIQGGDGIYLLSPSNVGPKLYGNQQAPEAEIQLPPPLPQPTQNELQWRFGRILCVVCGSDSHQSHSCPKRGERLFVH